MNRCTIVGRLTRDPDIRNTAGGQTIANMRVAVTGRGKDDAGNWTDKANYFDVVCFGRTAETVEKYLTKGRRIGVDGSLQWREWEKDGVKRQSVEILAGDIFFLDSNQQAGGGQARDELAPDTRGLAKAPVADSDVPF